MENEVRIASGGITREYYCSAPKIPFGRLTQVYQLVSTTSSIVEISYSALQQPLRSFITVTSATDRGGVSIPDLSTPGTTTALVSPASKSQNKSETIASSTDRLVISATSNQLLFPSSLEAPTPAPSSQHSGLTSARPSPPAAGELSSLRLFWRQSLF